VWVGEVLDESDFSLLPWSTEVLRCGSTVAFCFKTEVRSADSDELDLLVVSSSDGYVVLYHIGIPAHLQTERLKCVDGG